MESHYYKTEDPETGYSRYIRETDVRTVILSFGTPEPKCEIYPGKYRKQPGEWLQPCTHSVYVARHYDYLVAKKKALELEPQL